MAKYRIREHKKGNSKSYLIQRKSIFGFWYNPDNVDAETTGWHDTYNEALKTIEDKMTPTKKKTVWNNENKHN